MIRPITIRLKFHNNLEVYLFDYVNFVLWSEFNSSSTVLFWGLFGLNRALILNLTRQKKFDLFNSN